MKSNKLSNRIKVAALITAVALMCSSFAGYTFAFIITSSEPITNVFAESSVACEVSETFDGEKKSDVSITNTGNTQAYIRAAVVVTWRAEDGKVIAAAPVEDTDYNVVYANENGHSTKWIQGSDGYWYYREPVNAGASTENIIWELEPVSERVPDGFYLSVEIVASAIQSKPASAVEEAWGVEIENGAVTSLPEVIS